MHTDMRRSLFRLSSKCCRMVKRLRLRGVGADPMSPAVSPAGLTVLSDTCGIGLATDPQEIEAGLLDEPVSVKN